MTELLDIGRLYPNKMLLDYISCRPPIVDFFGECPQRLHSVNFSGDRSILKEILLEYNKSIDAQEKVIENIELLENENVMCVVTGQQPGFLTGPLYTIYKALAAINYAEKFSTNKLKLIPLFWNASEDHDVEEVNNICILTKENEIVPIKIEDESMAGKSLETISISKCKLEETINLLRKALPETDFSEEIFDELVVKELKKSDKWGEFFSRILTRLLGRWGLVIIEPWKLRPFLREYFVELTNNPLHYNRIFLRTTQALRDLKYEPKLHKKENIVGLFYIDDKGFRHRIVLKDNNTYELSNGVTFTKEEIINEVSSHPERFSTNAIFRPIAQDLMIPTYIYVAGPSEIGYHIQIKDLYKAFKITQPNILFRMGATLIEKHVDKVIQKYNFEITELRKLDNLISRLLKRESKEVLEKHFNRILSTIDDLKKELSSIDPELGVRVGYKKQSVMKILNSIEDMFIKYVKKSNEIMISQLEKARAYLFPEDKPQERVFNIFQYLNKYSLSLLECIKNLFSKYEPGSHVVMKCWML
ncbi:MAG: bacillithiol biosynthesis cysteine-adding enzyme BshC [Candidatus Asgardarchaeia archaeon]